MKPWAWWRKQPVEAADCSEQNTDTATGEEVQIEVVEPESEPAPEPEPEPERRLWARHLIGQSLTVGDEVVAFDSVGRSEPLSREAFDYLARIPCFALAGPIPEPEPEPDAAEAPLELADDLSESPDDGEMVESLPEEPPQAEESLADVVWRDAEHAVGTLGEHFGDLTTNPHESGSSAVHLFRAEETDSDAAGEIRKRVLILSDDDLLTLRYLRMSANEREAFARDGEITRQQVQALIEIERTCSPKTMVALLERLHALSPFQRRA